MSEKAATVSAVLIRLLGKGLSVRQRRTILVDATDPELLRDMAVDKLNPDEQMIVMALNLDWPEGRATAMDLSKVTGLRVSPRKDEPPPAEGERPTPTIVVELGWLEDKEWVQQAGVDERGFPYWELVPEDGDDD